MKIKKITLSKISLFEKLLREVGELQNVDDVEFIFINRFEAKFNSEFEQIPDEVVKEFPVFQDKKSINLNFGIDKEKATKNIASYKEYIWILSVVFKILKKFVVKENPDIILFGGNTKVKNDLYGAILNKKEFPDFKQILEVEIYGERYYLLSKN